MLTSSLPPQGILLEAIGIELKSQRFEILVIDNSLEIVFSLRIFVVVVVSNKADCGYMDKNWFIVLLVRCMVVGWLVKAGSFMWNAIEWMPSCVVEPHVSTEQTDCCTFIPFDHSLLIRVALM